MGALPTAASGFGPSIFGKTRRGQSTLQGFGTTDWNLPGADYVPPGGAAGFGCACSGFGDAAPAAVADPGLVGPAYYAGVAALGAVLGYLTFKGTGALVGAVAAPAVLFGALKIMDKTAAPAAQAAAPPAGTIVPAKPPVGRPTPLPGTLPTTALETTAAAL